MWAWSAVTPGEARTLPDIGRELDLEELRTR
jgi:hypothetical protein